MDALNPGNHQKLKSLFTMLNCHGHCATRSVRRPGKCVISHLKERRQFYATGDFWRLANGESRVACQSIRPLGENDPTSGWMEG